MNKLRVVFGTADGENISKTHFGDSEIIVLYEITKDGTGKMLKMIENRARNKEEKKHGDEKKRKSVFGQLGNIDLVVAGARSPNFIKINKTSEIIPCVSKITAVSDVVNVLCKRFSYFEKMIINKRENNVIPDIPVLKEE